MEIEFGVSNKKMMKNVIRKFGHEAIETIQFCKIVEKYPNSWLPKILYNHLMKK